MVRKLTPKHLDRFGREFAGRHNIREQDTVAQLASVASCMNSKRLTYKALISHEGSASEIRSPSSRKMAAGMCGC